MGGAVRKHPYIASLQIHPQTPLYCPQFVLLRPVDKSDHLTPCICQADPILTPLVRVNYHTVRLFHTIHRTYYYYDKSINKYDCG